MAAAPSVDPAGWRAGLDGLMGRVAGRFSRVEPRRHARAVVEGMLAGLPRMNCWTLAEHAGHATPDALQHLLGRARWDAEAVAGDLRDYVVEHLGDPDGVLVVDETGDLKKGTATVGVQRQYTGTAGRVENSQVAVYLAYAAPAGAAFLDRALYLPRSWAQDPDRRERAGVPGHVGFATKPALATGMLLRALEAGVPASWVTADEAYGQDPALAAALREHGVGYVLAVARSHRVTTGIGTRRAVDLAVRLPASAWQRLSAGPGAKGHRFYDWALIDTEPAAADDRGEQLLIRRHARTGELAFYRTYAPRPVPLARLVAVAGRRWAIEEGFQTSKDLTGLDQHQVRTWTSWHRWTILAMLAHAFLTITAAAAAPAASHPTQALITLTRNEIRRLLAALDPRPAPNRGHVLHWSHWRRRHQATARAAHYRRQAAEPA